MVKRGLTRDSLVALAHQYVADNGLDALTMRRLAAEADVTRERSTSTFVTAKT